MERTKYKLLEPDLSNTSFKNLAYQLVYRYRKLSNSEDIVWVDISGEPEDRVDLYFTPYKEILRDFGILGDTDSAPTQITQVIFLSCDENDEVRLEQISKLTVKVPFVVFDKDNVTQEDYELCRKRFIKFFHTNPEFLDDISAFQIRNVLPTNEQDYEKYIRDAGMVPVNVSDDVNTFGKYLEQNSISYLVGTVNDMLDDINKRLEAQPNCVGYYIPSVTAQRQSAGLILSAMLYVRHGKVLEYIGDRRLDTICDLTPRGDYALLESKIKFHMEYPVLALYLGHNMQYLCHFDEELHSTKSVKLYYFDLDKLGGTGEDAPKLHFGDFHLGSLQITPILDYFNLKSNDMDEYKKGHQRFLDCAVVIDSQLQGNLARTVLKQCVVFSINDGSSDKSKLYFGYCKDTLDISVQCSIVPLSHIEMEPVVTTFTISDFRRVMPISYISDVKVLMQDKNSILSKARDKLLKGKKRSSKWRLTFYEKIEFDVRAYLYRTGVDNHTDIFNAALYEKQVDITSICSLSELQQRYMVTLVPNLAKVINVRRLRELNFLSAFGGYVPGLSSRLKLSGATLKKGGLYGYTDIDGQS